MALLRWPLTILARRRQGGADGNSRTISIAATLLKQAFADFCGIPAKRMAVFDLEIAVAGGTAARLQKRVRTRGLLRDASQGQARYHVLVQPHFLLRVAGFTRPLIFAADLAVLHPSGRYYVPGEIKSAILWFALNFFQAALLAVTPDRVPASRRAMASWVFGFAGPIGALIGINMCAFASLKGGYAVLAIFLVLATAVFVVLRARRPLCPECNDFALAG